MSNGSDGPSPGGAARRFAVDLPAVLKVLPSGDLAAGRAVNVSATGIFVSSRAAFPAGTQVRVTVSLPVDFGNLRRRRLVARALVRWVNDEQEPRAPHWPPGMGLEFLDLAPGERDELEVLLRDRLAAPTWAPAAGRPLTSDPEDEAAREAARPLLEADEGEVDALFDSLVVAGVAADVTDAPVGDGAGTGAAASEALVIEAAPEEAPAGEGVEREPGPGGTGPRPSPSTQPKRATGGGFRLLLADPEIRELLWRERLFQYRPDREVYAAASGEELVALASRVRPMMVIFDADGLDTSPAGTVARIRRTPMLRTTPIVATAGRVLDAQRRLRGSGVDLVLQKPVDRRQFYTVLRLLGPESGLDVRVAVGAEVRYVCGGDERTGRVVNLSRGGLYLAAEPRSPVGTTLEADLRLPGFGHGIPVTATVRWVNDGSLVPDLPPGMGLQFVGTSSASLKMIATYVVLAKDIVRVT